MSQLQARILDLMQKGLNCSQVMLLLANEARGTENPDAMRAVAGLGGGMFCGENCGTLTGGAAVLALYGARSGLGEEPTYDFQSAIIELVDWFEGEFGSIECRDLVPTERGEKLRTCSGYVEKAFLKCMEILAENGMIPMYDESKP